MAMDGEQSNFRRGVMSLVLLSLLSGLGILAFCLSLLKREDMYGYQLVTEIQRLSEGKIVTQEGSLYPVLYKLEDQGLISSRKVPVGKRMNRVYYHLEPSGAERLAELIADYKSVVQGVFLIVGETDEPEK